MSDACMRAFTGCVCVVGVVNSFAILLDTSLIHFISTSTVVKKISILSTMNIRLSAIFFFDSFPPGNRFPRIRPPPQSMPRTQARKERDRQRREQERRQREYEARVAQIMTDFEDFYGRDETKLDKWQRLCRDVGVAEGASITQCKKVPCLERLISFLTYTLTLV